MRRKSSRKKPRRTLRGERSETSSPIQVGQFLMFGRGDNKSGGSPLLFHRQVGFPRPKIIVQEAFIKDTSTT